MRRFFILGFLFLSACANVDVQRVSYPNQPGIRYWRPSLYLTLQETKTSQSQTCEVKTLTLPDKTEEYAITFSPGIGTADVAPTLHEGWRLDALSSKLDSKTAENLNAIAGLLKTAAPGGLIAAPVAATKAKAFHAEQACAGVYKVLYDPQSGEFAGLKRVL